MQVHVVDGDGAVQAPGSRLSRPIAIQVTDETGSPVAGATVSFRLPDEGPSGAFASGLRTDITRTDALGRASIRAIQFGRISGQVQIRVTVASGKARAGTFSTQYIAARNVRSQIPLANARGSASSILSRDREGAVVNHHKWIWIGLAVAGAAGGGLALRGGRSTTASAASTTLTIGAPSIAIGKP